MKRFWDKVSVPENWYKECWEWTATKRQGYGMFSPKGSRMVSAHIVSFKLSYGDFPEGLFVLHKCDNRSCVTPNYLYLGTKKDNTRDMYERNKDNKRKITGDLYREVMNRLKTEILKWKYLEI